MSVMDTLPVGQGTGVVTVLPFGEHCVPDPLVTSTRKTYEEPYATEVAAPFGPMSAILV